MMKEKHFLLLGPVCRDTVITEGTARSCVGGAVYYQSAVLASLEVKVTAIVTLSLDDKSLLDEFHPDVDIVPVWTKQTMKFENNYPDRNNLNKRIQKASIVPNPILPEHINADLNRFDAVSVLPLSPFDIPYRTVLHLAASEKRIFAGIQGYLRHLNKGQIELKRWREYLFYAKFFDMIFCDGNEIKYISDMEFSDITNHAEYVRSFGVDELIVTLGSGGSLIATSSGRHLEPAFIAENEADATGMGDTYMAGYTASRVAGNSIEYSGKFASAVAALKLEQNGAFAGNILQIEERMKGKQN